jgi:hypothetical protein
MVMAARWAAVMRGNSMPLVVLLTSSMALVSAAAPVAFKATPWAQALLPYIPLTAMISPIVFKNLCCIKNCFLIDFFFLLQKVLLFQAIKLYIFRK